MELINYLSIKKEIEMDAAPLGAFITLVEDSNSRDSHSCYIE